MGKATTEQVRESQRRRIERGQCRIMIQKWVDTDCKDQAREEMNKACDKIARKYQKNK